MRGGKKEAPAELSIEAGPHAGVKRRLGFGVSSIGKGISSDIVLADDALADRHLEIRLSHDGVAITALDADVGLPETSGVLRAGETAKIPWPAHVTLGRSRLRLDLDPARLGPLRAAAAGHGILPMLSGAALLVAGVLLASQYFSGAGGADPTLAGDPRPDAREAVAAAPLDLTSPPRLEGEPPASSRVEAAVEQLTWQLAGAGLDDLAVDSDDGAVVVSGVLLDDQEAQWRDIEIWFDQRFGAVVPLDSRLSIDDRGGAPDIAVRAVWSGSSPYLVAGDGQRYAVGSILPGGWTVDAIKPNAIIFRQNRRTFEFELKGS